MTDLGQRGQLNSGPPRQELSPGDWRWLSFGAMSVPKGNAALRVCEDEARRAAPCPRPCSDACPPSSSGSRFQLPIVGRRGEEDCRCPSAAESASAELQGCFRALGFWWESFPQAGRSAASGCCCPSGLRPGALPQHLSPWRRHSPRPRVA